ncbi:glycosyltransferase involved in cell wall biosynthesis [Winogradskyella wandonensis]|uniref:Glycosyltransferase involved in cell wall biosynthesis n=1 Tax=Winogradskyella wandonensis TaxID=1442586 RepID=A0A4R1KVS8_9FLAO|nr:glycosyltransferase family 2 protein [Winogradskyella wandonensis]TCK68820.1 glycosyltransferase involved in cell wall biosynthesis [Winogradskyella wandonensis]
MKDLPLVSIIIPTYNRAKLIPETLDSVLAQGYKNWECLVVDDGSLDDTDKILKKYCVKDFRFKYFKRPHDRLPGGNAARNYGFELSKGKYIQWFDDDDLMSPNKIENKVRSFLEDNVDLVISKSKYFNSEAEFYHYAYTAKDISFESFAMGNVSWVTNDFMISRDIAKDISFNENLRAGQEYNYCCKALLQTSRISFIDKFLTLRRDNQDSIGSNRRLYKLKHFTSKFNAYWLNYIDISNLTKHKKFERFSLITCVSYYLRSRNRIQIPSSFYRRLIKVFGYRSIYFFLARLSNFFFGKYYYFYKRFKGVK